MTETLALVTSDARPRETAVADPRVAVRARVAARHPAKEFAVVDDELGERELVRVKEEGRDRKSERRDPEVDKPVHPQRHRDVEHHEAEAEAKVDGGSCEPRVERREVDARRRKATAGGDIPSASEREVGKNRVGVNLGGEDLENRREREEVLAKTVEGASGSALGELCKGRGRVSAENENHIGSERPTLKEEREEGNHKDEEDRDNAPLDPREDRVKVVARRLSREKVAKLVVAADEKHLVERAHVDN